MATFKINLGKMVGSDRNAGHLTASIPGPVSNAATPERLALIGDQKAGVTAVVLKKKIRRVYAPEAGISVVTISPHEYQLRFYEPGLLESYGEAEPTEAPFAIWRIYDPDGGTNDNKRLTFMKLTDGQTNSLVEYEWTSANSMGWRSGGGLREDQLSWSYSEADGSTNRTDVHLILNSDESVAERIVSTYRHFEFGDKLIMEQKGAEGEEITTVANEYYADPGHPGRYGKISRKVGADGAWIRYDYDLEGRPIFAVTPWLDGDANASDNDSVVVLTDYTCLDPLESPRYSDRRWRTQIKMIADQWVSTTYRAYYNDGDDLLAVTEQAAAENSAYGDEANRRTVERQYGNAADARLRNKPLSITHPDGTEDTWEYSVGAYTVSSPDIGEFTEQEDGEFIRVTETLMANLQEPYKSTRTVTIWDAFGREVQSETWVCTGSNQWERMDWQTISRDEFGRELVRRYANGLTTETTWGCCGMESETKPDGQSWAYVNDMLGRTAHSIKTDGPTEAVVYDAAGNVLSKTLSGGGLSLSASNRYDLAGRLVESWDEAGLSTTIEYGERTQTVTLPGGATETAARFRDGKNKSVWGTGVIPAYYEYGIGIDGGQWTKAYAGSSNSPAWNLTVRDREGQTVRTEQPGFGGSVLTNFGVYDGERRLIRESKTGSLGILYVYDNRGERFRSGTDVDTNGVLDLASMDRIQEQRSEYIQSESNWYHQQTAILYPFDGSAAAFTTSVSRTQVGGSGCACEAGGGESVDARGNVSTSQTSVDPILKLVTKTLTRPGVANPETTVTSNGLLIARALPTGAEYRYLYDGLGRQIGIVDPRTGTNRTVYLANGRIDYVEDAAGHRTTYGYDSDTGRRISVTDALTNTVHTAYDVQGRVTNTWGATYPVAYEYDAYGRMAAMKTWRDTNGAPDVTRWNFDEATGLLTNKVYADDQGPKYEYDAAGRLTKRIWVRGIQTEYAYDTLGQLTNIEYSDGTPDVEVSYNRMGQQVAVTDGTGSRGFAYDSNLQLQQETNRQASIVRTYDSFGRPHSVDLGEFRVQYGYDTYGRFVTVTSTVDGIYSHQTHHRYAYLDDSFLLASVSNGGLVTTCDYEPNRDLKTNVVSRWGTNLIGSFTYVNDAVGRRTERVDSGLTTNGFGYNMRSELVEAIMGTNFYAYDYDAIGNRRVDSRGAVSNFYEANPLNQYSAISNNFAPSAASLQYDLDGNLVSDGNWIYAWDAENRLAGVSPATTQGGAVRLSFAYDYMSRRVRKEVETNDGAVWSNTLAELYTYDGWNLVCEDRSDDAKNNYYVWGLDLSGSLQGAGGVGGLLALVREENIPQPLYYSCDANGNITDVVDKNGAVVAHYEYDGFGTLNSQSGAQAEDNPYRFSSKYWDGDTELYYYGYRFYSPQLGRWLSRDPVAEVGGMNLYGYVFNRPMLYWDPLGNSPATASDPFNHDEQEYDIPPIGKFTIDCIKPKPKPGEQAKNCTTADMIPLEVEDNQKCEAERDSALKDSDLAEIWKHFGKDCQEPPVKCKKCCGPCEQVKGAYISGNVKEIWLCWPNASISMKGTLMHEGTHRLQSCSKSFGTGCEDSLMKELQAYRCGGSCTSFVECIKQAARSSCVVGHCANSADITPAIMQNLRNWFAAKETSGTICNDFSK